MLKKRLLNIAVVIAVISVIDFAYEYIWPFVDSSGVIIEGSYRGIAVGDTKADVILKTTTSVYNNKLRIESYRGLEGRTIVVFLRNQPYHLLDSDVWGLAYPGIHQETVLLYFKKGQVYKIKYQRDMFSP